MPEARLIAGLWARYAALIVLSNARRTLTLREMVTEIRRLGLELASPANKSLSDALRWEVARGRVIHVGRGCYRLGSLPRATEYRARNIIRRVAAGEDRPQLR